jgi:protein-tyrosine sulfotransferase
MVEQQNGQAVSGRRVTGERLVFVGGVPRSGTTLLQHVLDSHSAVFGGPEFDCVPAIVETWRQTAAALAAGRITAFCTETQIDRSFADLIEGLLLPAADSRGVRLLSEKTPLNVLVFVDLLRLFPRCRVIHAVRDPRAVVASLLQVGARYRAKGRTLPDATRDLDAAIRFTRESLDAGFRAGRAFPTRVLTVIYEELVTRPETVAVRICSFLGLTFEPAMLEPHNTPRPDQVAIAAADDGLWLDPALGYRPIEQSRLNAWRSDLTPDQAAAVTAAFCDHSDLKMLGYQLEEV